MSLNIQNSRNIGHRQLLRSVGSFQQPERFSEQLARSEATVRSLKHLTDLRGHEGCVNVIVFSPSGDMLASGSDDGKLRLWNPYTFKCLRTMQAHQSNVFAAEFLPFDEQHLVSGGNDAELKYYDLDSEHGKVYSHHTRKVLRVAVHPEHPYSFMSCSADGTVRMIDTRKRYEDSTSGLIETVRGREGDVVPQALGGGRGRRRAGTRNGVPSAASLVLNYDSLATSTQLYSIDFNPSNGYQFIVSSDAGDTRLFDLRQIRDHSPCSYLNLFTHKVGNSDDITGCAFSTDGRTIVATALSDAIYTFDVSSHFEHDQRFPLCLRGPPSHRHPCEHSLHKYTPEMIKRFHDWDEARQSSSNHQHRPPFGADDYGSSEEGDMDDNSDEDDSEDGDEDDNEDGAEENEAQNLTQTSSLLQRFLASEDDHDPEDSRTNPSGDREEGEASVPPVASMEGQETADGSSAPSMGASTHATTSTPAQSANPSREASSRATRPTQPRREVEEGPQEEEGIDVAVVPNLRDLLGAWSILADEGGDFTVDLETLMRIAATQRRVRRQRRPRASNTGGSPSSAAPNTVDRDASGGRMDNDEPEPSAPRESQISSSRRRSSPYGPEGASQPSAGSSDSPAPEDVVSKKETTTEPIELPQTYKLRITGHSSVQTIKGVGFWGPRSEFVVSGSDDANTFIWDTQTGTLLNVLEGHDDVVNCVVGHPRVPILATSGIDDIIKLWDPSGPSPDREEIESRIHRISHGNTNQRRLGRGIQCAQQ